MPMKSLGVFFSGKELLDSPLDDIGYREAYLRLFREIREHGTDVYMIRGKDAYLGNGHFARGWIFKDGDFQRVDEPFAVGRIYNKGGRVEWDDFPEIINHPALDAIARDKWETYNHFTEHCPATIIVQSMHDVPAALHAIPSQRVVLKPLARYGGHGVSILEKEKAAAAMTEFPYLLQEFIEASAGIPGITDTYHDYRTIMAGDDVLLTMIRTPPPGSMISNVMQGGSVTIVPPEKRPKAVTELAMTIDAYFKQHGKRLYCIDCMLDRERGWKLIELNPEPGLMTLSEIREYADAYFGQLAEFLVSA